MRAKRKIVTFLLGIVMSFAIIFGVVFAMPKTETTTKVDAATAYNTKDIAMMGRVAGWYGNGNFEIRLTLGECDWTAEAQKKYAPSEGMPGDLPGVLRAMDFFNHIKVGGKTLAEWGCTTCYDNIYWLNSSEPDYTLQIPLSMGKENMTVATAAGVGSGSLITILEGALIPGDAYLQGNASATVYRAGCEFETISAGVDYGIAAIAKTEVEALQYTTGWDATLNNAYLGVSLKGDDYAGNGVQTERGKDYGSDIYMTNKYTSTLKVNGENKAEDYGLFNLGSKGAGYYSFVWRVQESELESITIPAGTTFPSFAMKTLKDVNGHFVYIMYQTQTDVTFYKKANGLWVKEIESNLTSAKVVADAGNANDQFLLFSPENNDYPSDIHTYSGTAFVASQFIKNIDFYSHILIDGEPLEQSGEAFINVWRQYGTFGVRPGNLSATTITVLAGCQFPTYNALKNGAQEVYVTTEDVTFVKNADGEWTEYVPAGDFDTSVTQVQFGRSTNVLNINLSNNDYPAPDGNNAATYNIGVDAEKILALNLFDNIIIDGYTLRSKYSKYPTSVSSPWVWINRFVGHNFAVRVPNEGGNALAANKIVIRAGAQFPSMAYINDGAQAFYVTTEEVTYVRVSDNVETSWERLYTITFMADGKKVVSLPYTVSGGIQGEIPEVPEKAGYKGVWESYTLQGGNIVVEAKYSEHGYTEIETNVSKVQFEAGFLIVYLTENDYPIADTLDVKNLMGNLHFFDYLEVDGNRVADTPMASDGAFLCVWNRFGSFATYLAGDYRHYTPTRSIVIKKGAQFPSNAQRLDGGNKTCYVLTEDVTFLYENGEWVRQSTGDGSTPSIKPEYKNDYVLSDLYQAGYPASTTLNNGYLYVNGVGTDEQKTEGNVYGYTTSDSFSLTFDLKLNIGNNDISALGNYTTFGVSIATHGYNWAKAFGWQIYLYRPGNVQKCVEFHSLGNGMGTWEEVGIFEKDQTYRITFAYKILDKASGLVETYISVNGSEHKRELTLTAEAMALIKNAEGLTFSTNAAIKDAILISDPDFTVEDQRFNVTVQNGDKVLVSEKAWKYKLPALNDYADGKPGEVFLGWTTDINTIPDLYPAGYEYAIAEDTTFYAVWMRLSMQNGAAVRKVGESGLRFLVDLDGARYESIDGFIMSTGTLVVPSSYLDGGLAFVHESFPAGYSLDIRTDTWTSDTSSVWTYAAALINISPAQYTRAMSARGYIKLQYTDGTEAYVYTAYSKDLHSRSIYSVATSAVQDNVTLEAVHNYVNSVADITINGAFEVSKTSNVGNYTVQAEVVDSKFTINFEGNIKALMINGTRILAGYSAEIIIDGKVYVVEGYKLNTNGATLTFDLGLDEKGTEDYYETLVEFYTNSEEYSSLHKEHVLEILSDWSDYSNPEKNTEKVALLESVKTKTEESKNVGATKLQTPSVARGDGYTVKWTQVENADYYIVTDSNDYRDGVVVMADGALSYRPEVVGKHNVSVTAYSYYDTYAKSDMSAAVATVEVKPVYTYKAMSDGLYKFSEASMKTLGLGDGLNQNNDGSSFYYDSGEKVYFVYYNKETDTLSKDQGAATDWTSPEEFPAHLANLKALGNNVILISEGSTASLGENAVWESSRMKYIMDTAWTLGMKVLVCDDIIYNQSKKVESKNAAKEVINGRIDLLQNYIKHPAFYGFSLEDEPEPYVPLVPPYSNNEIAKVGYMVQALKEVCSELDYDKEHGNEPFFLACLYQYAEGFEKYSAAVQYDDYLNDWFNGTGVDYVYVDLYTGHAMGDETNRYELTYDVVYDNGTNGVLGTNRKFYQVLTAHTQSKDYSGVLTDADLYMSILYAAAHNVAGYSWFCYFPISDGETAASMVGFNGNGYGNGNGINGAQNNHSYYSAAQSSAMLFEWIQGKLDGYSLVSRSYSNNLLTTTLSNGSKQIKMYVNADTMNMSSSVTVSNLSGECYILGYNVGTMNACYQECSGSSVTLQPGQAIICLG